MSVATQSPETDLLIPRPAPGEQWAPHTVHTHYFGFNIPEYAIGTFAYIRYMPALGVCQAGFQAYQGLDAASHTVRGRASGTACPRRPCAPRLQRDVVRSSRLWQALSRGAK